MSDDAELDALLDDQCERYPDMEPVDLYKALHQAWCGPAHAVAGDGGGAPAVDRTALWQRLQTEARRARDEGLQVRESEDVVEVLRESSGLVRVHLRPFLRAGGSLTRLHEAFVTTISTFEPDVAGLKRALVATQRRLADDDLDVGFDLDALRQLGGTVAREGYGPVSHSAAFRSLYAPAYRVIVRDHL